MVMCYAAEFPDMPGYAIISIDRPEYRKSTAKMVANWILKGATVNHVPLEKARRGFVLYMDAQKDKRTKLNPDLIC